MAQKPQKVRRDKKPGNSEVRSTTKVSGGPETRIPNRFANMLIIKSATDDLRDGLNFADHNKSVERYYKDSLTMAIYFPFMPPGVLLDRG